VIGGAVLALDSLANRMDRAWENEAWVRELAAQVTAVHEHAGSVLARAGGDAEADLVRLRGQVLSLLNALGDTTGQAIAAGILLPADCERVLGPDHPNTLAIRYNLAYAFLSAGRMDVALPLFERALADSERILGPGHSTTASVRANLADALKAKAGKHGRWRKHSRRGGSS